MGFVRWFGAAEFRPAYADARVMAILGETCSDGRYALLNDAAAAWQARRRQEALRLVVRHFATRDRPRFFTDVTVRPGANSARTGEQRSTFPWRDARISAHHDILFAVHAHRFGFAPMLAQRAAEDDEQAANFHTLLEDWSRFARAHPKLPFISNLVVTQRLFSSAWAFAFLNPTGSASTLDCQHILLKIISQDIQYLLPRLGHSYPNNHLLLDRFAAWFIALLYPEFHTAPLDLRRLEEAWLSELKRQTYPDGGSVEHSVHYHGLAAEMSAAYLLLSAINGLNVPAEARRHAQRVLRLQALLSGTDGHAPDIGDRSDDPLFALDDGTGGNAAPLREIYRSLVEPRMRALRSGHPSIARAYWLLDGKLTPEPEGPDTVAFAEFRQTGLALFIDDDESTRCAFRTGPIENTRFLPGHMHADLMSVTLVCRGTPMLVDAGTCSYRFRRDSASAAAVNWRDYFAGPRAHNGLIVGSQNPLGPLQGDFRDIATPPAIRHVARGDASDTSFLEARMDAGNHYPAFIRGVIHLHGFAFLIYNIIGQPMERHELKYGFQLPSSCEVASISPVHYSLRNGAIRVDVVSSEGIGPANIFIGSEDPTHGWVSARYGQRLQAPQLLFDAIRPLQLTAFALVPRGTGEESSIECLQPSTDSRCFRLRSAQFEDYVFLNVGQRETTVKAWGISFAGRLAWVRIPTFGRPIIRCIDGHSCNVSGHSNGDTSCTDSSGRG